MNIHHNLESIKMLAVDYAKKHGCNYNVILMNPDASGRFANGSTYEFVIDSYFEKDRPNVILMHRTDDIICGYPCVLTCDEGTTEIYVKDERTAFIINSNPVTRVRPGEKHWPIDNITKIVTVVNVTSLVKDLLFPRLAKDDLYDEPAVRLDLDSTGIARYEIIVERYGENYERSRDYERIFGKQ